MNDLEADVKSLERQLAEEKKNLRLIQEREAEYVLQTDIPLGLIKEERNKKKEIEKLKMELEQRGKECIEELARRRKEIEKLEKELEQRGEECIDELARRRKEIEKLKKELEQRRKEIEKLEEELEQRGKERIHCAVKNTMIGEKDGKGMVRVPAGEFRYDKEEDMRELPEFWIDRTPVTNAEYARFVADTHRSAPDHWGGVTPPDNITDYPVTSISWNDAETYARWAGKRLPKEEEWEKAASWNSKTGQKQSYPWGNAEPNPVLCNFGNNEGGTTYVGKYSPHGNSPYGCTDMAGNVWEWTASEYRDSDGRKVCRGGSWSSGPTALRSDYREPMNRREERGHVSFRCVLDTPGVPTG